MRILIPIFACIITCCTPPKKQEKEKNIQQKTSADSIVTPAIYHTNLYFPLLEGKNVALTVNQSSILSGIHLVDTLIHSGINVSKVFTPEHGFSGTVSDGEDVIYQKKKTNYDLISIYGKNKKPTQSQLAGIDIMVFDIQDVGVRFYTYISTMHYVMEACAEANIPVVILDRPNPNGSYVDGPVLKPKHRSFTGLHCIPIVHGLTVGELAMMINGKKWLKNGITCDLTVIKIKNWTHGTPYDLPVKPSPNLPNAHSIALYPSICLFEGTIMSVGRGTDFPFQQIGHPIYPDTTYSFTPKSTIGAKYPPYEGEVCYGLHWKNRPLKYHFSIQPLIDAYKKMPVKSFFNNYFNVLAGNTTLQQQIKDGKSEKEIRESWENELSSYKKMREKYLLYE